MRIIRAAAGSTALPIIARGEGARQVCRRSLFDPAMMRPFTLTAA
jgi:hypothetical protein